MKSLHDQIEQSVLQYASTEAKSSAEGKRLQAAMISGVSLTARFLAANEGGAVTPQLIEKVVGEVAKKLGFEVGSLKDRR